MNKLDTTSIIPLYKQLKDILKELIISNKFSPGEKIPSEQALSTMYNVSRITIRSALTELTKEGIIEKKRGKGTFVTEKKINKNMNELLSFSTCCKLNGMKPGTKVIKAIFQAPDKHDIEKLNVSPDDKIIAIDRIRYANAIPIAIDYTHFNINYSFLLQENLNDASIYEILENKYNIKINSNLSLIEIAYSTFEQSYYLNIAENSPLICITSNPINDNSEIIHTSKQYVLSDKFKLWI